MSGITFHYEWYNNKEAQFALKKSALIILLDSVKILPLNPFKNVSKGIQKL